MVDTSSKWSIQSVQARNKFDLVITNRRTGRASYMSQLFCLQQWSRIWGYPSKAKPCPDIGYNKVGNYDDFQLIVGQIQREYEAKDERMTHYLTMVEDRFKKLDEWIVRRVPHKENLKANALASIVATLSIKEAVMLPVYLQATPSTTP